MSKWSLGQKKRSCSQATHYPDKPTDFLDNLNADIRDFEQAMSDQHRSTGTHVRATAAIDTAIKRGMNLERRLDGEPSAEKRDIDGVVTDGCN